MRILLTLMMLFWSVPLLALEVDGQTSFAQTLALNSSISARVAEVRVVAGQRVAAGDLLLRLEDVALRASRDAAQAEVDAQTPRVQKARTELDKAQELFDRDSLALVELDNAEREFAIAEAGLAASRARLTRAEYRLSQSELRAPIDGIVLKIDTWPGHFVNTRVSDPVLLTIADDRNLIVQTLLPLENLADGLLKRKARMDFRGKSYAGRVIEVGSEIMPAANKHPALQLRVRFRTNGEVPAGLSVRIDIDDS